MSRVKRSSIPSNSIRIYGVALIFSKEFYCLFPSSQGRVLKKREFKWKYILMLEKLLTECLERKFFLPQFCWYLNYSVIVYLAENRIHRDDLAICWYMFSSVNNPVPHRLKKEDSWACSFHWNPFLDARDFVCIFLRSYKS